MKIVKSTASGFKRQMAVWSQRLMLQDTRVEKVVRPILQAVRRQGDQAVIRYTRKFDGIQMTPGTLRIKPAMIKKAHKMADPEVVKSLRLAAERITDFHLRQKTEGWAYRENGAIVGQRVLPLERVGLYVPGGKAAYPSSVLMNAIPATVAGVPQLVMCTPAPNGELNPHVLVAADLVGITEIYRIGGAQAVAAMAYGTRTIPRVDKIVGPGNQYVAAAKRLVYGLVDIDMIAGPSEILVIADASVNPVYLAADLLSQAEHDEEAWTILATPSAKLIQKIIPELERQLKKLPTRAIARASLRAHGLIIQTRSLKEAVRISNQIAPEHLEMAVRDPAPLLKDIRHAGSIFLGYHTPQALGDYLAGPNHVLPTGGSARFSSPLSVDDFIKRSSLIAYTPKALQAVQEALTRIARSEGLEAHARAVEVRSQNA